MQDSAHQHSPVPWRFLIIIAVIALAIFLNFSKQADRLDQAFYDWHLHSWARPAADDILIIAIDTPSLDALGRWPWPRRFHAKLLEQLSSAKAIGMDILLAEKDVNDPAGDLMLAKAIKNNGRVFLPVFPIIDQNNQISEEASLPLFTDLAAGAGHVDIELDTDGISRSVFLHAGLNAPYNKVLGLAMLDLALNTKPVVTGQPNPDRTFLIDPGDPLWIRDHHILIPFSGTAGHLHQVSYLDVLEGKVDETQLADKWIFIGMTASGMGDRIPIPVPGHHHSMPGVEFEAHVLDSVLRQVAITPLSTTKNLLITLIFLGLYLLMMRIVSRQQRLAATGIFILFIIAFSTLLPHWLGLWFYPAATLITVLLAFIPEINEDIRFQHSP